MVGLGRVAKEISASRSRTKTSRWKPRRDLHLKLAHVYRDSAVYTLTYIREFKLQPNRSVVNYYSATIGKGRDFFHRISLSLSLSPYRCRCRVQTRRLTGGPQVRAGFFTLSFFFFHVYRYRFPLIEGSFSQATRGIRHAGLKEKTNCQRYKRGTP